MAAKKRRGDKANYLALLVLGVVLLALGAPTSGGTVPLAVICFVGAGFYYWKMEKAADA